MGSRIFPYSQDRNIEEAEQMRLHISSVTAVANGDYVEGRNKTLNKTQRLVDKVALFSILQFDHVIKYRPPLAQSKLHGSTI